MTEKRTVAVLFGGQSGEHEVSLISAQAVMAALDPAKYRLLPIGITRQGQWIAGAEAMPRLLAAADPARLPADSGNGEPPATRIELVQLDPASNTTLLPSVFRLLPAEIDVVFPVLHGPMGEDGTVQGLLELAGLPYVGCGVVASAVGMDKALMKAAFAAADLPLLPWLLVRRTDWQRNPEQSFAQIEAELTYPLFVKPANMGSSVGISKAHDRAGLEAALAEAARYDRRIVVEQGIAAREIEVSVLGNEEPKVSIPGEVTPSGEWYDYAAKYLSGQSAITIPATLSAEQTETVRSLARRAFLAVDGSGLARIDFLLDKETGALWLNEINTMPGFTAISMYAKMWAASGLEYSALLDRLIMFALERAAR
jgi:D-alanine-D-alanine ligase